MIDNLVFYQVTQQYTNLLIYTIKFVIHLMLISIRVWYFVISLKHSIEYGTRELLFKLKQNGINGDLLKWIDNYLTNRKQLVTIRSNKL